MIFFFKLLLSISFITLYAQNTDPIVQRAKDHLLTKSQKNIQLPDASDRWQYFISKTRDDICNMHTIDHVIKTAQLGTGFEHRGNADPAHLLSFENFLIHEFPHFAKDIPLISETPVSYPGSLYLLNGRYVSNMLYYHMRYVLQCLTYTKPKNICEIGGGYGGAARIWMKNPIHNPNIYVMIDFPEMLFLAEVFLKASLSDVDILHISDIENIQFDKISNKTIILCPIESLSLLDNQPIDLVINTGSLQEMTEEYCSFWMNWLDNSQAKYFYSLNYFAMPINYFGEGANIYSPNLSNQWIMLHKKADPLNIFYQTRHWADIFAKRSLDKINTNDLRAQYDSLLKSPLNYQTFLDLMDIIRLTQDQEMIWNLISYIMTKNPNMRDLSKEALISCILNSAEINYIPKETYYLIELLKKIGDKAFLSDKHEMLEVYEKELRYLMENNFLKNNLF
ncbi:MAG: hypothetical protein KR126chlam6_01052 [Candidatus Anoxychlamydiales bacterium]|nr:hypothetical protein [Candidatus Anoxychlamydiales bacterium]